MDDSCTANAIHNENINDSHGLPLSVFVCHKEKERERGKGQKRKNNKKKKVRKKRERQMGGGAVGE